MSGSSNKSSSANESEEVSDGSEDDTQWIQCCKKIIIDERVMEPLNLLNQRCLKTLGHGNALIIAELMIQMLNPCTFLQDAGTLPAIVIYVRNYRSIVGGSEAAKSTT